MRKSVELLALPGMRRYRRDLEASSAPKGLSIRKRSIKEFRRQLEVSYQPQFVVRKSQSVLGHSKTHLTTKTSSLAPAMASKAQKQADVTNQIEISGLMSRFELDSEPLQEAMINPMEQGASDEELTLQRFS